MLKHRADELRSQIQADKIIKRMAAIHDGKVKGHPALLAVQISAGRLLLAKSLPDLQAVEITGPDGGPLQVTINKIVDKDDD